MIVVTGGAGMIGSGIVRALNAAGERDILVVDDLSDGTKFRNLNDLDIADYEDKDRFLSRIERGEDLKATHVLHQGACSSTTEWDGRMMMETNYRYSKLLFHYCQRANIPFVYASSAAVYGASTSFAEVASNERPLNVYGYSKKLFDDYVRRMSGSNSAPVIGLRYFNVYGPREGHKGSMASVAFHLFNQISRGESARLFGAWDGCLPGEQSRDFIHVDDVADVNLWAMASGQSGIVNCGTGRAESFLAVANSVIGALGKGEVEFVEFPDHLKGRYQSYTRADILALRAIGYAAPFRDVATGVRDYIDWLQQHGDR